MDDFPWATLFTLVGTLAAVGLTGYFTSRSDWRRLRADKERETRELERDDAAAVAAAEALSAAEAMNAAGNVRDLFLDELRKLRGIPDEYSSGFEEIFERGFRMDGDIRLRRAIADVRSDDQRKRLTTVVDALNTVVTMGYHYSRHAVTLADEMFVLGSELAATFARGQAMSAELQNESDDLEKKLKEFFDYLEETHTLEYDARKLARAQEASASQPPEPQG